MPSCATHASAKPEVAFPVLRLPKLELRFADGTTLWLRQYNADTLQRAIDHQGEVLRVDLRAIAPRLQEEVYGAAPRDQAGMIFFTLRQRFRSSEAFLAAVLALQKPACSPQDVCA